LSAWWTRVGIHHTRLGAGLCENFTKKTGCDTIFWRKLVMPEMYWLELVVIVVTRGRCEKAACRNKVFAIF
jgi:hypothetical protein